MASSRARALLVVAGPPLVLALLGAFHPMHLTDGSAPTWRGLHVVLLPVFPLLALGPWWLTRREPAALRWAVVVLGYAYAAFYTALDVLAGIGAGALQGAGAGAQRGVLFAEGNDLSADGVWAYLAATVVTAAAVLRRARLEALPGAVLTVAGAVLFLHHHVSWPVGGLSMLALAVGGASLVLAVERSARVAVGHPDGSVR